MTANQAATFMGTVTYMAPERCMGEDYDFKSDVWSVGMVIFEMASGRYPFADISSFPAMLAALMDDKEPRLEGEQYSPALQDFVAICLTRDVAVRQDTTELLTHEYATKDVATQEQLGAYFKSCYGK